MCGMPYARDEMKDRDKPKTRLLKELTHLRKRVRQLRKSERRYRELVEGANSIIMRMDQKGNVTFFNEYAQRFFGYGEDEILGRSVIGTIVPEAETSGRDLEQVIDDICNAPSKYKINENENMKKGGERVFISWTNKAIYNKSNMMTGVLCVGNDITERKRAEDRLVFLSLHDTLTGLRNRTFFEQQMKRAVPPLGIIMFDIDGLKLVNDTLGHDMGDRLLITAAGMIKECFRGDDVVARIGGDEFAVLLKITRIASVERIIDRIQEAIKKYNDSLPRVPLSISIGYAIGFDASASVEDIFKEADNNMYREKLEHGKDIRSTFVSLLLGSLEEKGLYPVREWQRVAQLAERLAAAAGLRPGAISDMLQMIKFRDVGMAGVPEDILLKPERLTADEIHEMRRHCEISYRIARSVPELIPVAELILQHHEWWNGEGYPNKVSGESIPIECRVAAIAEAYNAMTSHRPYRQAMSHAEALQELKDKAGTQFDEKLVQEFLEIIEE